MRRLEKGTIAIDLMIDFKKQLKNEIGQHFKCLTVGCWVVLPSRFRLCSVLKIDNVSLSSESWAGNSLLNVNCCSDGMTASRRLRVLLHSGYLWVLRAEFLYFGSASVNSKRNSCCHVLFNFSWLVVWVCGLIFYVFFSKLSVGLTALSLLFANFHVSWNCCLLTLQ